MASMKSAAAAILLVTAQTAWSAEEKPLSGQTLGNSCAGCHGTYGVPAVSYIPPLAGMSVEQFTAAMVAYRDGTRSATMMNRIAPAFTDEEIVAMAEFFAGLSRPERSGGEPLALPED